MITTPRGAGQVLADRLEIDAGPLLGGGGLVRDYLAGHDLSPFYTGHFSDPQAYARKAVEVESRLDARARAVAGAAIEPLGDAADRLRRILGGDGFFVTTGQQPALFGGPLYTIYKILSAIRQADVLEQLLGRPVLALFWVGSDDHDWDEANHAAVFDAQQYVHRITVSAPDVPPLPLSRRRWGPGILPAVDELSRALPRTHHADDVLAHVREAYAPQRTVAESFTATMRWLLHDRRVAVVDSAHPALRRAGVPVLKREAERTREHNAQLARQTERLEAAGYDAQVAIAADASNLMVIDEHGRDRLMRTGRGWQTRREHGQIDADELLGRIATSPDSFSPNVLLRPVVENAVFPTIAYVAGPGELSYFAQIGCLFAAHGILPPVLVPRASITLIEPKVRRLLDRLGVEPDALRRPFRDVAADAVAAEVPADVQRALADLRRTITEGYRELEAAAAGIDPTLRGPLTSARNASLLETRAAEKRILAGLRRRHEVKIEQLRRVAAQIQPEGSPQERVLGPLPLVAEHGRGIIAEIEARIDMRTTPVAGWSGPRCDW